MGKKLDKLKELQKKDKNIVVDKTFGLKNKNKSKKVQQFVKQVHCQKNAETAQKDKLRTEKKNAKIARMEQEMELKALFSEGLSITVKKKDLHKKKSDSPAISSGGGGGGGPSDHYDDAWAEAELAKAGLNLALEDKIEKARAELREKGLKGTPVTPETFAAWKKAKVARLLAEKQAAVKAEQLKKKGGKGLSILTGKDLYQVQKDLFVDDEEAGDSADYAMRQEVDDDPDAANYDENGKSLKVSEEDETVDPDQANIDEESTAPVGETKRAITVDGAVSAVDESLYLDDADLDDLNDLDDD